jgi:hypothetical protein
MQTAVLRGAAVHLVVSEKGNQRIVSLAQASHFEELLEAGAQVQLEKSPVSKPRRNQRMRCSEVPYVKESEPHTRGPAFASDCPRPHWQHAAPNPGRRERG